MNGNAFDALTRQAAAAISRRRSFLTLGGAALTAAIAAPSIAEAGKAGKKAKKKCKKQVDKCEAKVRDFCELQKGEEECLADLLPCCQPLKGCNAGESTECFLDNFLVVM